jgi:hypothetical protein
MFKNQRKIYGQVKKTSTFNNWTKTLGNLYAIYAHKTRQKCLAVARHFFAYQHGQKSLVPSRRFEFIESDDTFGNH